MLGDILRGVVGLNVETDNDRIRSCCQIDIALVDIAYAAVDDAYSDLVIAELDERLLNRLNRAHNVGLDDDIEVLDLALLDLREQTLEGCILLGLCDELFLALGNECFRDGPCFLLVRNGEHNLACGGNAV